MNVNVILFGDLSRFKPEEWSGRRGSIDVPEGATIDQLADRLGIGEEPSVVMLNDEQHHRGAELHEGDTVTFLPPIAGGGARPRAVRARGEVIPRRA
jgi:sulfur carrier protein ThiS